MNPDEKYINRVVKAVKAVDPFAVDPTQQVKAEVEEAIADLYRDPSEYHHLPWPALDKAIGGMPGGEICFVVAFSSNGKTLFLTSMLNEFFERTEKKIANGNYEDALRQITSLRASQITPEEARAQIEGMHHLPDPRYHTWLMGRNKLRDIAGMGPQPHEVPPHMPG